MTLSLASRATIVELLCERAAHQPDRLALRFLLDREEAEEKFSYAQLHARACTIAGRLAESARPGERALLLYPNGPEYVCALLGCFYAGVIAVPAYPPMSVQRQHVQRVASIARNARPRLLLAPERLLGPLALVKQNLPELAETELLATDALPLAHASAWRMPDLRADQPALLQYTSGSTAEPKGVIVAHGNLMANERAIQHAFAIEDDDVVVSWLPLFHDMGLIGTLLQPLFSGVPGVLMTPQQFMLRPERWLEAISRYRGTVSGAPDFAYRLCVQRVDEALTSTLDLSSWRLAFCGAEPVRHATLRAFADKFAPAGFDAAAHYPCYGLAEATLLVSGGRRGSGITTGCFDPHALRAHRAVPSACGQVLVGSGQAQPEHTFSIVDPATGARLASGEVGEIEVAGPSIAQGYWQNPDATEQTFVRRGERVYLRTGDLGFEHAGELFVAGRKKDMIIVRGQNLYPQDIERGIEDRIELVRKGRTVAFAVEHEHEEAIAVAAEVDARIQRLIDAPAVCRSISQWVAEAHGEAAQLVLLLNAGTVPITSSGKLQRAACREAWRKGELTPFAVYEHEADARSGA